MRDLPPALQQMMLPMQVGQATQPFGSLEEGVRVLVICGRDEVDLERAELRPGLQPDQRRAGQHARAPLSARPAPRRGDRIPLEPELRLDGGSVATVPSQPLAISLGDPAGIGPEVIAKCWDNRAAFDLPPFVAIGDPRSIAAVWDGPIELIDDPRQADSRVRLSACR